MGDGGTGLQDMKHMVLSHTVAAVDLEDLIKSEDHLLKIHESHAPGALRAGPSGI